MKKILLIAASAAALAGCDYFESNGTPPPPSTTGSVAQTLSARTSETDAPVDLDVAMVVRSDADTSETALPFDI